MDRRSYLKALGASGAALTLAGCSSNGGGGSSTGTTTGGTSSGSSTTAVTAGTAPGFPPFEMTKNGKLVGFDVDLLTAVVKQSDGYTLKGWQQYDFSALIQALTASKVDVLAAGLSITDKRKQTIAFSDPYWDANQSILVRQGSSYQPKSLADLAGHKVGAQSGTTGESDVQNLIKKGTLKQGNYNSYKSYVLAVTDLVNGNIDAVVLDKPVAETFVSQQKVTVSATINTGEQYGFGVRKSDDSLQGGLNAGLKAVKSNGTYDDLKAKWFASGSASGTGNASTGNSS